MRLKILPLFLLLTFLPVCSQTAATVPPKALPLNPSSTTNTPPRAFPVNPTNTANAPKAIPVAPATNAAAAAPAPGAIESTVPAPGPVAGGVNVHWYGHGFIYLTSSVGIRCAFDPFSPDAMHYKFPVHIASDLVLITHEADDHAAADQIFGNPLIFRSVMAVGLNRANGIPFYGVALTKPDRGPANTAFTISFDGVKFGYLGQVNAPLLSQEKEQLGHVDVLFLPVGLLTLSAPEFNQIAKDVGARIIIPINYKTPLSGEMQLRTLDDYLSGTKLPERRIDSSEIAITRASLPTEPTLYILKSP